PPIPRGSMLVVFRCRMTDGRGAGLKVSPNRARLADEAAALEASNPERRSSSSRPTRPGGRRRTSELPAHQQRSRPHVPDGQAALAYLFDSSVRLYDRHPELTA